MMANIYEEETIYMGFKIELEESIVTSERVYVASESTLFVNVQKRELPSINGLLAQLKEVRKLGRNAGVKIQRAGYKAYLEELRKTGEYEALIAEYNDLLNALQTGWTAKLEKGLYAPLAEDAELDALSRHKWRLDELFYRSSPLSKVNEIKRKLDELESELKSDECTLYSFAI